MYFFYVHNNFCVLLQYKEKFSFSNQLYCIIVLYTYIELPINLKA